MLSKSEKLIDEFKNYNLKLPNIYKRLFKLCDNNVFSFCKQFLFEFKKGSIIES